MNPCYIRRNELSVEVGCLLWGSRVVVPTNLRSTILDQLHDCHPGISRMKALARSYVWWPRMDSDIQTAVRSCNSCQLHQKNIAKAPIHPWEWTNKPWIRIHLDYAGPYSKWLEILPVSDANSKETIQKLRVVFATYGLPEQCVTDNGSHSRSVDFEQLLQRNGIKQLRTSPYHPPSNGMAERMVQTFESAMGKWVLTGNIYLLDCYCFCLHTE